MDLTALPDKVKGLVRAQIETGHFQSVDEFVCEAPRVLQWNARSCSLLTASS